MPWLIMVLARGSVANSKVAKPRRKHLRNRAARVSSSPISGQPIEITLTVIGSANWGTHFFDGGTIRVKSSPIPWFSRSFGNTGERTEWSINQYNKDIFTQEVKRKWFQNKEVRPNYFHIKC